MFILSQVQGASHLELTNLSFNYLGSQHVVSKHFDPHLHQTNLFSNLIPKRHLAYLPKKRKKPHQSPQQLQKKKKKKKKHTNPHNSSKEKKNFYKNQFLHQAQSSSCLAHIKVSISRNNEQFQSMTMEC